MVEAIEKVAPKGESVLAGAIHETAERLDRRALVVLISDFMVPSPQVREGLAHLRHDRHEVIALRVLDRDEIEFPFRNWTRFRGIEGERASLCEPALVRKRYRDNQRRHARELEEACRTLPPSAVLLASSPSCPVQMFRVEQNVYATQFHPELDVAGIVARVRVYQHAGYFPAAELDQLVATLSAAVVTEPGRMLATFVSRYG